MVDELKRDIRAELEGLHQSVEMERYLQLSGTKAESHCAAIFEGRPHLLDPSGWQGYELQAEVHPAGGMVGHLIHVYVDASMAGALDSYLETEFERQVSVPGQGGVSLRRAPVAISRLADRSVRSEAHSLWRSSCGPLVSLTGTALANATAAVRKVGFDSLAHAVEAGMGIPLSQTAEIAASLMAATADIYRDVLSWVVKKKCGVDMAYAEEHDLEWLSGPFGPTPPVPFDRTRDLVLRRVSAGRSDSPGDGRLSSDLELRDGKVPVPLCVQIKVPERVIILAERRDAMEYARLHAHELGRGQTYALLERSLPYELRYMVDPAVPHAWGYAIDWTFLEERTIDSLSEYHLRNDWLPLGVAMGLARHRKDSAFVMALAEEGGGTGLPGTYSQMVEQVLEIKSQRPLEFRSLGDLLDPIHRLRGLMLALSLRSYLRDRFGDDWGCDAESGAMMLSLWEGGGSWTPESLTEALGLSTMEPGALVREAERALGRWQ